MKVVTKEKYTLMHGSLIECLTYIKKQVNFVDLIVFDPNYDEIKDCFSENQYMHVFNLLEPKYGILLHYTYSANGSPNCKEAIPHVLISKLEAANIKDDKYSFKFKTSFTWIKYPPEVLKESHKKRNYRRTATANDCDIITIFKKGRSNLSFSEHVNFNEISENSSSVINNVFADPKNRAKPYELCKRFLKGLIGDNKDAIVVDTHMGHGNLAKAAKDLGIKYYGIETQVEYFNDVVEMLKK